MRTAIRAHFSLRLSLLQIDAPVTFEDYLALDQENATGVLRELRAADSQFALLRGPEKTVETLLDEALTLFETFDRDYGDGAGAGERRDHESWSRCAQDLGIKSEELRSMVANSEVDPDPSREAIIVKAREAWNLIQSRYVRGLLLASIGRSYVFSVTDLLRLRVTPAVGHQRLAAEAVALIMLIQQRPSIAAEWLNAPLDGKAFYFAHQQELKAFMKNLGLADVYDLASGSAQHVRLVGLAQGIEWRSIREGERITQQITLNFQEIPNDEHKTRRLLLFILSLLTFVAHIFELLPRGLPEITDPLLLSTRIPKFRQHVQANREKFERTYPDWAKQAQAAGLSGWRGSNFA